MSGSVSVACAQIGEKLGVKPSAILQIHKEPDILVGDDDDVARLKPNTMLEVRLRKGREDLLAETAAAVEAVKASVAAGGAAGGAAGPPGTPAS